MGWRRLPLWLALLSPLAGCSYVFVQPLSPTHHPGDRPDCTSDPTAPIVDSGVALVYAGSSVYAATRDDVAYKGLAVAAGVVNTAVWLSSAIYGYVETSGCRAAKAEADEGLRSPGPILGRRQPPLLWAPAPSVPPPPAAPLEAPPAVPSAPPAPQRNDPQ